MLSKLAVRLEMVEDDHTERILPLRSNLGPSGSSADHQNKGSEIPVREEILEKVKGKWFLVVTHLMSDRQPRHGEPVSKVRGPISMPSLTGL